MTARRGSNVCNGETGISLRSPFDRGGVAPPRVNEAGVRCPEHQQGRAPLPRWQVLGVRSGSLKPDPDERTADDLDGAGDPPCPGPWAAGLASRGGRVAWAMPGNASRRRLRVGRWRLARRDQAGLRPLCGGRASRRARLPGTPRGHHRGGAQADRAPAVEELRFDARVGRAGEANTELMVVLVSSSRSARWRLTAAFDPGLRTAGSAWTTSRTRTRGAREREEGTHTFALTGHRRVCREADGERVTEITIPAIASAEGVLVRGRPQPQGSAEGSPELRDGESSLDASKRGRADALPRRRDPRSADPAPLAGGGERHGRGPLRLSIPEPGRYGQCRDHAGGDLAGAAPHGTSELQETRTVGVAEVTFDAYAFDAVPRGFRVYDAWVVRER